MSLSEVLSQWQFPPPVIYSPFLLPSSHSPKSMAAPAICSHTSRPTCLSGFPTLQEGTTYPAAASHDQAWRALWTRLEHFSVFYTFFFLYFSAAHVLEHSFLPAQVLTSPKFIQFTVWLPRTHIPIGRSSLHLQASPLHDLPLSPQISMSTGMPPFCPDRLPSTSTLTLFMIIIHLGATFESSLWDFTLFSPITDVCFPFSMITLT